MPDDFPRFRFTINITLDHLADPADFESGTTINTMLQHYLSAFEAEAQTVTKTYPSASCSVTGVYLP